MGQYTYKCPSCQSVREIERTMDEWRKEFRCRECGEVMRHQISVPTILIDGSDPSFPTAAGKWTRDRMRRMAKEKKTMAEHGTYK
ncbi:MAG: hypothetical protein BMS9Abin05_2669 [Rhodothermia bacterium]|nr:MAG: hypothetical protein BMS9Abin05_2669 [Rhodothermia bacterium]